MFTVGLTGSVSTGKSTVAMIFKMCGAVIVDADKIAHQLLTPKGRCYQRVIKSFGREILIGDTISRQKISDIVFKEKKKLRILEAIIHPEVRREINKKLTQFKKIKSSKIIVVEIPLLFEVGYKNFFDVNVVVSAIKEIQKKRALKVLDVTPSELQARIANQWPLKKKIRHADFTIYNNGTKLKLKKEVGTLWEKLSQMEKELLEKKGRG